GGGPGQRSHDAGRRWPPGIGQRADHPAPALRHAEAVCRVPAGVGLPHRRAGHHRRGVRGGGAGPGGGSPARHGPGHRRPGLPPVRAGVRHGAAQR
ncbi:YlmC/YmxH family sporulation protein, partial [Dysosmobacter welbionis]